eukprot:2477374-Pleurochrysis_carterae.AAC.4
MCAGLLADEMRSARQEECSTRVRSSVFLFWAVGLRLPAACQSKSLQYADAKLRCVAAVPSMPEACKSCRASATRRPIHSVRHAYSAAAGVRMPGRAAKRLKKGPTASTSPQMRQPRRKAAHVRSLHAIPPLSATQSSSCARAICPPEHRPLMTVV